MSATDALQAETTEVLQRLIRFNTVNPPGNERPAIEYLERFLADAGFETEILGANHDRANLVATLSSGDSDNGGSGGPTMVYLGHLDTVLADPADWIHDPWSAEIDGGYMWGRGTIDMKNQVAAEAVAGVTLARAGWRPARGALKLVFVADEETGGEFGAQFLCEHHPDKVRCEMLINEGGGGWFEFSGRRHYGICCAEKGIFRFKLTAHGAAGHASIPRTGDNALLKLGPVLQKLAAAKPSFALTEAPAALLAGLGLDPSDPQAALDTVGAQSPALQIFVEPMLGVTLTPTMAEASRKINVIPARASLKIDCRVPPGLGEEAALGRLKEVLGDELDHLEVEFTEKVFGNGSPVRSELTSAIEEWVAEQDPEAVTVPLILPGFSDSSHFRAAFPECAAYGFFPQRHQPLLETAPLMHNSDERIDVRDLGFAADCYLQLARRLLG
jgi:acetylornithine deacetylase/succinyl-diaminopimelate desuccinylase-like protein